MKRVLIVGVGGAGKTTLARPLAAHLEAAEVPLDSIAWKDAKRQDDARVVAELERRLAADRWVVDGTLIGLLGDHVAPFADTIVWVDTPLRVAALRTLRRGLGWLPAAVFNGVGGVLVRRRAARLLAANEGRATCVRLRTTADADRWLASALAP